MSKLSKLAHVSHADPTIAYHSQWGFRREAIIWDDEIPLNLNFHPIANELRRWLLRQGHLTLVPQEHKEERHSITNPYSYHSSAIAGVLVSVIQETYEFAHNTQETEALETEIKGMRLYNEQTLNIARFCESAIKQLLFCTQIPTKYYARATLGALLSTECLGCKGSKETRHRLSLLGSLAHRYGLCLPFEHCLFEHLKIVGRRRNIETAHSDSAAINVRPLNKIREQLERDSVESAQEFVHMLDHIAQLEKLMQSELESTWLLGRPMSVPAHYRTDE